jgi:hypothetical protein
MGTSRKVKYSGTRLTCLEEGHRDREPRSSGEKLLGTVNRIDHEAQGSSEPRCVRMSLFTHDGGVGKAVLDRCDQSVLHLQVEVGDPCWTSTRACLLPTSVDSTLDGYTATV